LQTLGVLTTPLYCEELNYTFEKRGYAWIQLDGETSESVIYIHEVHRHNNRSRISYHLLATRYMLLNSTYPFVTSEAAGNAADYSNELVLHFGSFDKMQTLDDAETILLEDVQSARSLDAGKGNAKYGFNISPGWSNS
jgi:hypothetical protein